MQVCSSRTVATFLVNAGQRELLGQYQSKEQELVVGCRRLTENVTTETCDQIAGEFAAMLSVTREEREPSVGAVEI